MRLTPSEQLREQTGAENPNTDKATSLVSREELTGTPYYIVRTEEYWFISFANYQVTEQYKHTDEITPQEVLQKELHWIIMRVAGCMHEKIAEAAMMESQQQMKKVNVKES